MKKKILSLGNVKLSTVNTLCECHYFQYFDFKNQILPWYHCIFIIIINLYTALRFGHVSYFSIILILEAEYKPV